MHVATAKALLAVGEKKMSDELWKQICAEYVKCWDLMDGRGPGIACAKAMGTLKKAGQIGAFLNRIIGGFHFKLAFLLFNLLTPG